MQSEAKHGCIAKGQHFGDPAKAQLAQAAQACGQSQRHRGHGLRDTGFDDQRDLVLQHPHLGHRGEEECERDPEERPGSNGRAKRPAFLFFLRRGTRTFRPSVPVRGCRGPGLVPVGQESHLSRASLDH
jgi:hypothetical protein